MAGKLFTIGYEGRDQESYLARLEEAGVTILADVRSNPLSRKRGFSKKALAAGCAEAGIRYEHLPELGIPSAKRKGVKTQAAFDALFAQYERDWLPQQGETLAKLRGWLEAGERVALTCYERDASRCHRRFVVEALGVDARHL